MKQLNDRFHDQKGSSLLEVMVTLMILSVGLMGLAMLQLKGMQFNTNAYFRSQASLSAGDIIERMRINPGASNEYAAAWPTSAPSPACNTTTKCSSSELAAHDLWVWSQALTNPATGLPGATALIAAASSNPAVGKFTITISWSEQGSAIITPPSWVVQL